MRLVSAYHFQSVWTNGSQIELVHILTFSLHWTPLDSNNTTRLCGKTDPWQEGKTQHSWIFSSHESSYMFLLNPSVQPSCCKLFLSTSITEKTLERIITSWMKTIQYQSNTRPYAHTMDWYLFTHCKLSVICRLSKIIKMNTLFVLDDCYHFLMFPISCVKREEHLVCYGFGKMMGKMIKMNTLFIWMTDIIFCGFPFSVWKGKSIWCAMALW